MMKNRTVVIRIVLSFCILFLSAFGTASAESPAGKTLLIKQAVFQADTGILSVTWTNTGKDTVAGAELRINPRDGTGNPVVIGEGYTEEILLEHRVLHTAEAVPAGETVTSSFVIGGDYPGTAAVTLAFDRIILENGTILEWPEDRLCWYSTDKKAYTAEPENSSPYLMPDSEIFEKAKTIRMGFKAIAVTEDLAEAYGFPYCGLLITEIEAGSLAEGIELETGDLIRSVNGMDYSKEPYLMTYAAAALAEGKPVTITFDRDGEEWSAVMQPE